jgi:hypothetical protein
MLMILLALVGAMTGCSRKPVTIVGTWQGSVSSPFGGAAAVTLVFNADGSLKETFNGDDYVGTYTITGNQLRLNLKTVAGNGAGQIDETDAFQLNGDELVIQTFAMTQNAATFSRQ